jgi:hypothetical protein
MAGKQHILLIKTPGVRTPGEKVRYAGRWGQVSNFFEDLKALAEFINCFQ